MTLLCLALSASLLVPLVPSGATADPGGPSWRGRGLPALVPGAPDALSRALQRGRVSEAEYALARAASLFELRQVRKEFGEVIKPDPHAATLYLRDLALRAGLLRGEDRKRAAALLARPDDNDDPTFDEFGLQPYSGPKVTECTANYCLHWGSPSDSNHRPPQTDSNSNGKPDFVDSALTTMNKVWSDMATLGFRPPKSDATSPNKGPNNKIDIYLANIGSAGVYGYCSTDDPNAERAGSPSYPYFDFSAYCVLDNDYSMAEFPEGTPLTNLQVTTAHEFFHAIQFAYDGAEDGWLMEGTATAIEDVVYDDINDNLQFLTSSQLTDTTVPLDYSHYDFFHPQFGLRYGAWLFWRFMTEELAGGPPMRQDAVIRQVWERADASAMAAYNDEWSLKAAKSVSKQYGVGFKKLFQEWGVALLFPESKFEEGAGYTSFLQSKGAPGNGRAKVTKSFVLDENRRGSGWFSKRLHHLTSRYYRFLPGSNVGPNDMLKVKVLGPKKFRGTSATLVTVDGPQATVRTIRLNKKGDGSLKVLFPDAAYLILQNASTRVGGCYQNFPFTSCSGFPKDDNLKFQAKGKLIEG